MLWPLGLTNRVLAGVDALTYFTPYWAYRMAELRAGHLPLWNPYLFTGVPFLANPQAAVLYPLHWPLSWLTPSQALVWSALLHVWLAAGFTYTFARRSLKLSRMAATLAGLIFGLGGFTLARVENINQLNTLAWLPALLWLADEVMAAREWRGRVRWGAALGAVIALQLLAGHTQTAFVNLVGLALWAAKGLIARGSPRKWRATLRWAALRKVQIPGGLSRNATRNALALPAALLLGLLLSAAQLVPTLELNGFGWRTGGLTYRQAVSFSLRPRLLAQSFLPPWRGGLAEAFGSEGYAEFVAYIGLIAMLLALLGAWKALRICHAERSEASRAAGPDPSLPAVAQDDKDVECTLSPRPALGLILLALAGVFLALGAYNPLYYLLWRFVPGFDLFRAPVRWLALYAAGMAGLAGIGLDAVLRRAPGLYRRTLLGGAVLALTVAELWLAGRALPFAQATAPAGLSLRNAPAALLAATADEPDAGRDRFLSLSDIRYDPGDLAELRSLQAGRLPAEAIERLVRTAKQVEVLAPNLPLLLHLPAVDGYDGGALPTEDYVKLESLYLPPELVLPDGRLREQLASVPAGRLLDLVGVRFVITDKQRDLWAEDVYYDLELPARIEPGQALALDLRGQESGVRGQEAGLEATDLGMVVEAPAAAPDGAAIAEILVEAPDGRSCMLSLAAGPLTRGRRRPSACGFRSPCSPCGSPSARRRASQAPSCCTG